MWDVHVFFILNLCLTVFLLLIRALLLLFLMIIRELNLLYFSGVHTIVQLIISKVKYLFKSLCFLYWTWNTSTAYRINQWVPSIRSDQLANSSAERVDVWVILWDVQQLIKVDFLRINLLSVDQAIDHVLNARQSHQLLVWNHFFKLVFKASLAEFNLLLGKILHFLLLVLEEVNDLLNSIWIRLSLFMISSQCMFL